MSVTVIDVREMVNDGGAPPWPDTPPDTLFAEDWNPLRLALHTGELGIFTSGVKVGVEGLEFVSSAPVRLIDGVLLTFLDGGDSDAQVGYLDHSGELGMQRIRVNERLFVAAGVTAVHEGLLTHTVPVGTTTNIHEYWKRDVVTVKDFEVDFRAGTLSVLHILKGDYAVDRDNSGFIFKNPTVRTILRMNNAGGLEVADVDDWADRPLAFSNVRQVMLGTDVFVDSITGIDGVVADEVSSNPKRYVISLSGVQAAVLDIGLGALQVGPDTLAAGGLVGSVAAFVTPAEKALIGTLNAAVTAILAELPTFIKVLRTATSGDITPTSLGVVNLANSSSVIFDKPGDFTLRAVSSGGGGGGAVNSVTAGNGLGNTGSSSDPVLVVNAGSGIVISGDAVNVNFGGSGAATTVSRSDHDHTGVYSPVAHTHTGVYIPVGGAYQDLVDATKIGTGSGQVAAGNDARFHTQNTDLGTDSLLFTMRRGYGGTPANGDIAGIVVERGTATDARIYFQETLDKWFAGIAGSEAAIILEGDSRLSDVRNPTVHALSFHSGQLDAARVDVTTFSPSNYTAGTAHVDSHLLGIDGALAGKASTSDSRFGGQTFVGAAGSIVASGVYLLGTGASGEVSNNSGKIDYISVNAEKPLAGGTSILIRVQNLTQATFATVLLGAADTFVKSLAVGLDVDAGDEISIDAQTVVGLPAAGVVVVRAVRT